MTAPNARDAQRGGVVRREVIGRGIVPAVTSVLTLLLWPVRSIVSVIFPFSETDGLSSAVTAKAAQYFVQYLRTIVLSPNQSDLAEAFSTSSFSALKEDATARQSLIFLYLHSPLHGQAKEACEKILFQEPLTSWIQQQDNQQVICYGVSIHTGQGAHLQNLLNIECFPAIAILQPGTNSRSSLNLLLKAEGWDQCANPQYLLPRLHLIQQAHQATLNERAVRRMHREQEEELRRQQDAEFAATLQADRERERKAQEERESALAKQEEERLAIEEAENKIQRLRDMILPEPDGGMGAEMRFCLPTGAKITRRFGPDQTVGALKAYLRIHCIDHAIPMGEIGLSTNFPRRVYDDDSQTLQEAELAPRAVLMNMDDDIPPPIFTIRECADLYDQWVALVQKDAAPTKCAKLYLICRILLATHQISETQSTIIEETKELCATKLLGTDMDWSMDEQLVVDHNTWTGKWSWKFENEEETDLLCIDQEELELEEKELVLMANTPIPSSGRNKIQRFGA